MTRAVQETTLRSLDRRLEVPPADDELRRLAETFNEMLGRMQAGVADLTRLTAEASHELRTPVSLVRTSVDVALAQPRSAEEYRDALREILGHAEQMSALVTDLLTLARADAGVEAGDAAPVDLSALARDVGHQFERSGAIRGVSCEVAVDADVVVLGDESSLRRLVTILMDNAVKYTPATGRITLAVSRAGDSSGPLAVIEVTDTGIGVDPADRSRVFDRFYRGAQARQMAADGSGLGLPIARAIVERAHGTIALDSGPGGGGCRVTVRLPVDRRLEEPHALHGTRDLAPDVASADAPRAGHAGA
jgi:signal transduction histidine kinase